MREVSATLAWGFVDTLLAAGTTEGRAVLCAAAIVSLDDMDVCFVRYTAVHGALPLL